jgi:four helix bundle protein
MQDVKELRVWQIGIELCRAVYRATSAFPRAELYGLTSQMRRAAIANP